MTRCESYPPCFGTIYFPTAPFVRFRRIVAFCAVVIVKKPSIR